MKTLLAIVLLFFTTAAHSQEWNQQEKQLGAITTVAYILDWKTTRDMTKRYDEGFYEKGLIVRTLFGSRPSTNEIDMYFAVLIPAVLYTAHSLPEHRKLILTSAIVVETVVAIHNRKIGLSFRF